MASDKESYDGIKKLSENPKKSCKLKCDFRIRFLFDEKGLSTKGNRQLALLSFQLAPFVQLATRNSHDKCNSQLVTRTISATRNSQNICNSQLAFATRSLHFTISQFSSLLEIKSK